MGGRGWGAEWGRGAGLAPVIVVRVRVPAALAVGRRLCQPRPLAVPRAQPLPVLGVPWVALARLVAVGHGGRQQSASAPDGDGLLEAERAVRGHRGVPLRRHGQRVVRRGGVELREVDGRRPQLQSRRLARGGRQAATLPTPRHQHRVAVLLRPQGGSQALPHMPPVRPEASVGRW